MATYKPLTEVVRDEVGRVLATITTTNGYNFTITKVYGNFVDVGDPKKTAFPYACYYAEPEEQARAGFGTVDEYYSIRITIFADSRKNDTVEIKNKIARIWGDVKRAFVAQRTTSAANILANSNASAKFIEWYFDGALQNSSYKNEYGFADGTIRALIQRNRGEA